MQVNLFCMACVEFKLNGATAIAKSKYTIYTFHAWCLYLTGNFSSLSHPASLANKTKLHAYLSLPLPAAASRKAYKTCAKPLGHLG